MLPSFEYASDDGRGGCRGGVAHRGDVARGAEPSRLEVQPFDGEVVSRDGERLAFQLYLDEFFGEGGHAFYARHGEQAVLRELQRVRRGLFDLVGVGSVHCVVCHTPPYARAERVMPAIPRARPRRTFD